MQIIFREGRTAGILLVVACTSVAPHIGPKAAAGVIVKLYNRDELAQTRPGCLSRLSFVQIQDRRLVEVRVVHGRPSECIAAIVAASITVAVGSYGDGA